MIRSVIKKTYLKLTGHDRYFGCSPIHVQLSGQEAADLIRTKILEGSPLMVTRFGGTELSCILNYYFISKNSDFREFVANLGKGIFYGMSWSRDVMNRMSLNAGFFSSTRQNLERYVKMSIEDMRYIDILGSWLKEEQFLFGFMKEHKRVHLEDLFPLNAKNPWSEALRGKRVLVVHPFAETIASQFKKRASLFKDGRVLPDFELMTLKAIQTIAGTRCEFNDWFEALDGYVLKSL